MTESLQVSRDGRVAIVTMNDPQKRNALSLSMREAMLLRIRELMCDDSCGAIVLTGAGGHFCSGGDIDGMKIDDLAAGRERLARIHDLIRLLISGPKPVIAAAEGTVAGGGFSLAAAADFVVTSRSARWQAAFIRIGLLPDMGAMWTVPRRIGMGHAKRLFAFGEPIDGEEAKKIGLADEIVDQGDALSAGVNIARKLADAPLFAFSLLKAAMASGVDSLEATLRTEVDYQSILFQTEEHKAAIAAFLAKRNENAKQKKG